MSWITSRPVLILAVILLILLTVLVLKKVFRRLGRKLPDNGNTWRLYLSGQGTLLFLFLLLGVVLSWGSWAVAHYAPGMGGAEYGGRLVEFRDANPGEHPVYEEIAAKDYGHLLIMTRTTAPENASATVTLYDDQDGKTKSEMKRLDSLSSAWTRWEHQNANRNVSLVIESSDMAGSPKATKVDVLIYLSTR